MIPFKKTARALKVGVSRPPVPCRHAQALPAVRLPHRPGRKGPYSLPASPTALDPFPQSPGTHSVTKELSAKPIWGIRPESSEIPATASQSLPPSLPSSHPVCTTSSSYSSRLGYGTLLKKKSQSLPVARRLLMTSSGGKVLSSQVALMEHSGYTDIFNYNMQTRNN